MRKETPATQPVQYSAGEYRQFHVIKAGTPSKDENGKPIIPEFDGEQGVIQVKGDIITDDDLLLDYARSRGFMVRHYGTLRVEKAFTYAGRDNVQVYTKEHGIVSPKTKFEHEVVD